MNKTIPSIYEEGELSHLDCWDLNKSGPHRLTDLKAWLPGNGTIRRCGLFGGSASQGVGLEV